MKEDNLASETEHSYRTLTFWQCLVLGTGGFPDVGMQYAIKTLANPIFNICYGVDPIIIGIAMSLPRFWEIILDPWIGVVSDGTRGPLGRRHPYMIGGAVLGGLAFIIVWWVPMGLSTAMKGWWLIALTLIHFTGYSFFMVPYSALLGEVSPVPAQRVKVMAFRSVFVNVSGFGMGWLYWLGQMHGFRTPAEGMKIIGIIFGLILIPTAVAPVFACRKSRKFHASIDKKEEKLKEFSVIRELLKQAEFRAVLISILCIMIGCLLVSNLGFYLTLYYLFNGDTKAAAVLTGVYSTVVALLSILAAPLINLSSRKLGQKLTLFVSMALSLVGNLISWWALSPRYPYASVVTGVLTNLGMTAFWVIMPAITGEISHDYEQRTGKSIYGSFYALFGMAIKIGASIGLLFTGVILNCTGFNVALGNSQSPFTIFLMRILYAVVPAIGIFLAMFYVSKIRAGGIGKMAELDDVTSRR